MKIAFDTQDSKPCCLEAAVKGEGKCTYHGDRDNSW